MHFFFHDRASAYIVLVRDSFRSLEAVGHDYNVSTPKGPGAPRRWTAHHCFIARLVMKCNDSRKDLRMALPNSGTQTIILSHYQKKDGVAVGG